MKRQMPMEPDRIQEEQSGLGLPSSEVSVDFVADASPEAIYGQFLTSATDNFDAFPEQRQSEIFLG